MKLIFKYRGLRFLFDKDSGEYVTVNNDAEICRSINPLEAWTQFSDMFDLAMRRRIGSGLEIQGLNRWTGSPVPGGASDE